MSTWAFVCLVLFVTGSSLAYDAVLTDESHRNTVTINDHHPKEPNILRQWITQPVSSPGCPQHCSCMMNDTHHIISVDCSSKGLTTVPDLPQTIVELSLRNNSICNIACNSFKLLMSLMHLDLSSNKIQHLPPCLFQSQSSSLLNLNISENNIDHLDVKLFKDLFHLKKIDLSNNIITCLAPYTFADLAHLIELNLSFNYIDTIALDAFKGLYSLKNLSLENNRLDDDTSFHSDVFQDLLALETLSTRANLGSLDNAIAPLRNLSHLYMDISSKYRQLGIGFRHLVSLQYLRLSTFAYFSNQRYKNASTCSMSTVPSNFFSNIRTEKDFELHILSCGIKTIGNNTFQPLSTLVTLDLRFNKFKSDLNNQSWMESLIKTRITYLDLTATTSRREQYYINWQFFISLSKTNLKTLILKGDSLSGLIPFQHFPTAIETLDISLNPGTLDDLYTCFQWIDLRHCKLRELRANVKLFRRRKQQSMINTFDANKVNRFRSSDTDFKRPDGEELQDRLWMNAPRALNSSIGETIITLKRNCPRHLKVQVICLPAALEIICANTNMDGLWTPTVVPHIRVLNNTVLRHVELADNQLTIWQGPIENVPSLKFLDLSLNHCEYLDVNFFKHMVNLETLIVNENSLGSSLAADVNGITFSTLTKLKVLDISQNSISELSTLTFIHNTNLEKLDLSDNRLSDFQSTISTIRNMSFLDLSVNFLPGISEQACKDFKLWKSRNKDFTVNLLDNRLLYTCDYLHFLDLIYSTPGIFFMVEHLQFKHGNGTKLNYMDLAHDFPLLSRECQIQRFFDVVLITFFVVVGTVIISAVIYHKRWRLRYLYYIGQRRMHLGEPVVEFNPDADIFITYDQDDLRWRHFMQQTFLPGLNQMNITYILGETDFPGGDLMAHLTGAVVGTKKTVVLLSSDVFDDHHREFEMNLAIMREMDTRSLKIVPVFVEEVDLALYPREIEIFLRNQWQRCLSYSDSDYFWDGFVKAVREDN